MQHRKFFGYWACVAATGITVFAALNALALFAPSFHFVQEATLVLLTLFYLPNAWLGSLICERSISIVYRVTVTVSLGLVFWVVNSYVAFIAGVWLWLAMGGPM